jgi:predicted XRE-type DNA-binding protein
MRIKKTQRKSANDRPVRSQDKVSKVSDSSGDKAGIVQKMVQTIEQKGLTQRVVGDLLGISQPKVSLMLRGQLNSYTTTQLSGYLRILSGQSGNAPAAKAAATKTPRATKSTAAKSTSKASSADSGELPSKAAIVKQIGKEIARSGLSQRVVGNLLGISQPKISLMLRGQLNSYTAEQLSGYLSILTGQAANAPAAVAKAPRGSKAKAVKGKAAAKGKAVVSTADAGDLPSKAEIVKWISKEIQVKGLSQRVVGDLLGLSQPQVSLLLRGRFNSYSVEQLSDYLNTLTGQSAAPVSAAAGRKAITKIAPTATPAKKPGRKPQSAVAVSTASATLLAPPTWMEEEIAYLRQQLALSSTQRGKEPLLAEIDHLRRENAALQKKTERFDQMTALFQSVGV